MSPLNLSELALFTAPLLHEIQPAPLFPVFHYWTNWFIQVEQLCIKPIWKVN